MEGVVSKKAGFVSSYIHSLGLARFLLSCLPSPLHRRRRLREMANLPPSLSIGAASFAAPSPPPPSPGASSSSSAAAAAAPGAAPDRNMASAEQLVLDLCDPELRENALLDLSKVSPCREKLCVFSPLPQFSFFFYPPLSRSIAVGSGEGDFMVGFGGESVRAMWCLRKLQPL